VQIYVLPLYHQARDKKINPESREFETANHCFFELNPRNGKSVKIIWTKRNYRKSTCWKQLYEKQWSTTNQRQR